MMYFAYDKDSLIERLSAKAGGANIYWAYMEKDPLNDMDFRLIDVNVQSTTNRYADKDVKTLERIEDISKHIIIVWDGNCTEGNAAQHYRRFNNMLSKVVYDVKLLNGGLLPKVNLVGYSYGGIINMQYSLDHPDMVENVVSIDSTYLGSDTAAFGNEFFPTAKLLIDDLINPVLYNGYRDRWNAGYDEFYSQINLHAVGGYSTLDYFLMMCEENKGAYPIQLLTPVVCEILILMRTSPLMNPSILSILGAALSSIITDDKPVNMISDLVSALDYDSFWEMVLGYPVLKHDVLSPLYSQLGQARFSSDPQEN